MLSISRSSFYYAPVPEATETLALMQVIGAAFLAMPWYGSRHLRRDGHAVGRRRVRRLMSKMGLSPIYQRLRTSDPHLKHRGYPYLLCKLVIDRPNHVWCADITYIPMPHASHDLMTKLAAESIRDQLRCAATSKDPKRR